MSLNVKVYDNGDHACLVWLPADAKPIAGCRGFTIRKVADGKESYLHGFVGFSDDDKFDPTAPWKFPVQRYMWNDYGVAPGDVVQYSVVPVVGPDKDHLKLSLGDASALTTAMTVTGQSTPHVSSYFNKGMVSAQWVSRALAKLPKNAKLADQISTPGNPLRDALSGLLRPQLLSLLDDVKKNNGEIYAALYELNDPELKAKLVALGKKCHLLLANGAFKKPDNDENKAVRAELRGKVDLYDRLVTSGHFAHNKFVVFCDSTGAPVRALSGSTNWTVTGLCTQANNGVIVDDAGLASDFLDEWKLLKDAGNAYPPTLASTNSQAKTFLVDGSRITQWFAPTSKAQDLDFARQLINGAKDGILFLFFNPGAFVAEDQPTKWTLLQNILSRHHADNPNFDAGLYMRGVVNQQIPNLTGPATDDSTDASPHPAADPAAVSNPVTLFKGGKEPPKRLTRESMVPANVKTAFHNWAAEVMNVGVHVHSKVIVLDPFGEHPVVMTGSHNLGYKASSMNDDNLMIIEGNAPLAAAFASNIIAIYQAYRWNAYVEANRQDPRAWHGLTDDDTWQQYYLSGDDLAEIKFWLGEHTTAAGQTTGTAAPGLAPARAISSTTPPAGRGAGQHQAGSAKKAPGKKASPQKKPPAVKKPVAKKPVAKKPVAKKPVAKTGVGKKSVVRKRIAQKPTAKKPASKKRLTKRRSHISR